MSEALGAISSTENNKKGQAQWLKPVIPALRKWRSRGSQFEASLGKRFSRLHLNQ
jgi:hypothetical protein